MKQDNNIIYLSTTEERPTRDERESRLNQRAKMIWFSGLSGSGKSTLAEALEKELHKRGYLCRVFDGDLIRSGLNNNLGFSSDDRVENIRRIAEVGRLFIDTGVIVISAFISPTEEVRSLARGIIGEDNFLDIHISTPLEECERRDVKGLYKRARRGEIKDFTGISQPFEEPHNPTAAIDTTNITLEQGVQQLLEVVLPQIRY